MHGQVLTVLSLLAASASAIPLNHVHEHVKRDYVTITQYVTVTPHLQLAQPDPTPSPGSNDLGFNAAFRGGGRGRPDAPAPSGAAAPSGAPAAPSGAPAAPSGDPTRERRPEGSNAPAASAAPSGQAPSPSGGATPSGAPASSGGDFMIDVQNNCPESKQFGIYQITSSFAVNQITNPVTIPSGGSGSIAAPFNGIGMRLSASAGAGTAGQWSPQALFEFGYSEYAGQTGTAYDASVMGGDEGLAIYPANPQCPSKVCTPSNCAASQGWTNPDQVNQGSPGDTVCYQGKTNFKVVWCP